MWISRPITNPSRRAHGHRLMHGVAMLPLAVAVALSAGCGSSNGTSAAGTTPGSTTPGSTTPGSTTSDSATPNSTTTGPAATTTAPPTSAQPSSSPTSTTAGPAATITIKDFSYGKALTVAPGAKITVHNADQMSHTVSSDTTGKFDLTVLPGKDGTLVAPTAPGTYPYHCTFHGNMHGTLTVR